MAVRTLARPSVGIPPAAFSTWSEWNPRDYLRDYYAEVQPDEVETIRFLAGVAATITGTPPVLVFGSGPTMHHVFPVAPYASALVLVDFLQANLDELRSWRDAAPDAHDWSAFGRYALRCRGVADPTAADVAEQERMVRRKIVRLATADAGEANPLGAEYRGFFPVVVSCYCADSATSDPEVWTRYMRNIASLTAPGGLFITAALRNARSYTVGNKRFPSANVGEGDMRRCLERTLGLVEVSVETRVLPAHEAHGYTGIILAHARRPGGTAASGGGRTMTITLDQARVALLVLGFTALSGIGDAQGFVGASRIWVENAVVWREVIRSGLGFAIGAFGYWFAVRYLREFGVRAAEVQTLFWFAITIVAVGVLSGTMTRWQPIDRIVASAVLLGIGWLLVRVAE